MNRVAPSFTVGARSVGDGRCFIIAEVAQAHDGSLGMAHAYIDAASDAGADAVKFQTHIAAAESTLAEPWRVRFSQQDASRYAYWKRMEFTAEQWAGLATHAADRGIEFLSSPFSDEAADLLDRLAVPAWKVASGEVTNTGLLQRLTRTGRPIILSSGLSSWDELDSAVTQVRNAGNALAILQCTTAYPCPPEKLGLNVMQEIRERYNTPVGLSDHSGVTYSALAATAIGADILELHITFSRRMFGPDVPASLTVEQLADVVQGARFIDRALAHPVDKDAAASGAAELRTMFLKSVVAVRRLEAGRILERGDMAAKKPGSGIPAARLEALVGARLLRDVDTDEQIREEDLEDPVSEA